MRATLHRSRIAALFVGATATQIASSSHAQTNEDEARRLFDEAADCVVKDDRTCACPKFEASYAILRRASTLVQIAICKRLEKDYVQAWKLLQEARELNGEDPVNFRASLDNDIKQEMIKVPTIKIQVSPVPAGIIVTFDGEPRPADVLGRPIPVALGDHTVELRAPGFAPASASATVRSEQAYTLVFTLVPLEPTNSSTKAENQPDARSSGRPPERQAPPVSGSSNAPPYRTAGLVLGGIGLVGAGVAALLGVRTLALVDESNPYCRYPGGSCDQKGVDLRNSAEGTQLAGIIVAGASSAIFLTGVVLYLSAPQSNSRSKAGRPGPALVLSHRGVDGYLAW